MIYSLWWTDFKMILDDPHLLVFTPLCNPFLLTAGRMCDVLLTDKIWQRWWAVTPVITSCYIRLCINILKIML